MWRVAVACSAISNVGNTELTLKEILAVRDITDVAERNAASGLLEGAGLSFDISFGNRVARCAQSAVRREGKCKCARQRNDQSKPDAEFSAETDRQEKDHH